jgi:hypothetical protein
MKCKEMALGNFCGTCRHWRWQEHNPGKQWNELMGDSDGLCRRHAPRPLVEHEGDECKQEAFVSWPNTIFDETCGEHERQAHL